VVVSPEGVPVPDAEVHASSVSSKTHVSAHMQTRTDERGRFAIERIVSGRLSLEARARGYASSQPQSMVIEPLGQYPNIEIRLTPAVTLRGIVVDARDLGLPDVEVQAHRDGSPSPPMGMTTDESGEFVIEGLSEGSHMVTARRGGYSPVILRGVQPGDEPLEIHMVATGGIRGQVVGASGEAVTNFNVRIEMWTPAAGGRARPGSLSGSRFLGTGGTFSIGELDPGSYDIVVTGSGFAPARKKGIQVLSHQFTEVELALSRSGSIEGRVRSAKTGEPIAGAQVMALSGYDGSSVATDADGHFQLKDVTPGRRSLAVRHQDYVTKSEGGIDVVAGNTRSVDVLMSPLSGEGERGMELAGIGVVLGRQGEQPVINAVVPEGPAAAVGLVRGDLILAVDGRQTAGVAQAEVVELLRGPPGSRVRLDIGREGNRFSVTVTRANVRFTPSARKNLAPMPLVPSR